MNNDAERRGNSDGDRGDDRVRDVDEFDLERTEFNPVSRLDGIQADAGEHVVLFQTPLHQRQSERRTIHRNVYLADEKRNRADVVFMAVGQDQTAHHLAMLLQIGEVRRHDIHAQEFRIREHHSGVDDDDVVAVADGHGIHTEFPEAAEGDELELAVGHKEKKPKRSRWEFAAVPSGSGHDSITLGCPPPPLRGCA